MNVYTVTLYDRTVVVMAQYAGFDHDHLTGLDHGRLCFSNHTDDKGNELVAAFEKNTWRYFQKEGSVEDKDDDVE